MRPNRSLLAALAVLALPTVPARAQVSFGAGCAGASGVTPELAVLGAVRSGSHWTLEVTAPGGLGLGYLLLGFSNTSASALGGAPLPVDLEGLFADALWASCFLNVDPSYAVQPYLFDPSANGGRTSFTFPGFDVGDAYVQALNVDPDFVTRVAGVSRGLDVIGGADLVPGLVAIPAGTFQMGSAAPDGSPYYGPVGPVHTVTISEPFWMGAHEVTQAEYTALTGSNPSAFLGPDRPVESVSWLDAQAYCTALTAQQSALGNVPAGYEYRLPTEAEWEYACRARTTTEFSIGAELLCSDARIDGTFHPTGSYSSCGSPTGTADVGGYAPNPWGLFDVHGNVWEWCLDSYAGYGAAPKTDPYATGGTNRVVRGGAWVSDSGVCRSASRSYGLPTLVRDFIGFRVVLAPVLVP